MGKSLILEVHEFLDERGYVDPVVLIQLIINYFRITKGQALEVYKEWKLTYMKTKFSIPKKRGRWGYIKS